METLGYCTAHNQDLIRPISGSIVPYPPPPKAPLRVPMMNPK